MKLYDVTKEMLSAEVYPGGEAPVLKKLMDMRSGELYNYSELRANMHSGTHIDSFLHFIDGGRDISELPLEHFYGEVLLIDAPEEIDRAFVEASYIEGTKRMLFRTGGNGYLTPQAAEWLSGKAILTLGIDAMSFGTLDTEVAVHVPLLKSNIALIEALALEGVPAGKYILSAFPLKIAGAEASPVRAVLCGI